MDPREVASVVVATIEGALMLSKFLEDSAHMWRAVIHLKEQMQTLVPATKGDG